MYKQRIIMGGLPRSGSSLIRSILNAHHNIVAPPETSVFLFDLPALKKKPSAYYEKVAKRLQIPSSEIIDTLRRSNDEVSFFDDLMEKWRSTVNKNEANTWIEKTPRNCLNYPRLAKAFSSLKFISTIRDGRDVITSIFPGQEDYYCSIQRYIETVSSILDFEHSSHLIVKYEDFIRDPDYELSRITSFIGVDYDSTMLTTYTEKPGVSSMSKVKEPLSGAYMARWRQPQHSERVEEFLASKRAVECLLATGYSSD